MSKPSRAPDTQFTLQFTAKSRAKSMVTDNVCGECGYAVRPGVELCRVCEKAKRDERRNRQRRERRAERAKASQSR